jgi:transcriptional repressor NrdR
MRCPTCGHEDSKVVDSRTVQSGGSIRRRRECEACGRRFTTYERIEESLPMIVKRDGRRESYDRKKLLKGLRIACRKRPVRTLDIDNLADEVERQLVSTGKGEVDSAFIGDRVMEGLRHLDQVAYIRFASVYKSFQSLEAFGQILESLDRERGAPDAPGGESADDTHSASERGRAVK